ncbi:tetrahydromethanopterin S-methyltransferase subunit MtrG [Methanococcus maripaludis]|jgi:tetrahydromethanopterin S-methyltransferase subunit G|uniref:Tetrahydromethanopterin S-methyltransferase subunit G n=7 Tax=Methanococcus maripaludis TaxID=39152 RepID=MTRG_METMP|nr:tetrahydromethanopterin S-methyltransferase subunit G [Methanococcus maripaludis]Q6LWY8.1 RecName: Full=Tetrahydromethanopterin S-methyltransferase subunit G; AltName: Full=N5-methyltetrahydromethanopterin--coenzyme M methyltransferase subunit G [Methanococcus maripaludis S2]AEK20590.1 tetrahydromethanopterin S-methyltransferase subunit G [Methanococcus maripaludis X1]AVB76651.1 tetrahydromethanopterin S-methyltransferase subunit G [Methanococcus maripaludis]MBA2839648.1 tetrahydromethanopte
MSEIPTVVTPTKDYKRLQAKLDEIENTVENTNAEIIQRTGKKAGRDVGIAYGLAIGFIFVYVLGTVLPLFDLIK